MSARTLNMSIAVFDDLYALLQGSYDETDTGDLLFEVFKEARRTATSIQLVLTLQESNALADLIEGEKDHPFFEHCQKYLEQLEQALRTDKPLPGRRDGIQKNSMGGYTRAEFLNLPRKAYQVTYRGKMPAALVRLVETLAWELRRPTIPYITWRFGDVERLERTHKGQASGRYTYIEDHIVITAGDDNDGNKATLLHELAHWQDKSRTPHGPAFWRYVYAFHRRFRVPMWLANYGLTTAAMRAGKHRLQRVTVKFPNAGKPCPTKGRRTTAPVQKPAVRERRFKRLAARRGTRKAR